MREILFRGKRIDNGEWVYGGIEQSKLVTLIYDIELPYCNQVQVIPETIGQYTGITDKNGVKIYEGDICSLIYYQMHSVSCVEFNEKKSRFELRDSGWTVLFHEAYKIEVIGNVYDNPKLMEV